MFKIQHTADYLKKDDIAVLHRSKRFVPILLAIIPGASIARVSYYLFRLSLASRRRGSAIYGLKLLRRYLCPRSRLLEALDTIDKAIGELNDILAGLKALGDLARGDQTLEQLIMKLSEFISSELTQQTIQDIITNVSKKLGSGRLNAENQRILKILIGKLSEFINSELTQRISNGLNETTNMLHQSTFLDRLDVVKSLIEEKGVDPNIQDNFGLTPLHLAALSDNISLTKYFIKKGANFVTANDGNTPLHVAAFCGNVDIVKYLIEEKKIDCNLKGSYGMSLLHLAVLSGNSDLVKYLIEEKSADPNAKDKYGMTSLHCAIQYGELNIVKYLVEKGADFNIKDNNGKAPLNLANERDEKSQDIINYLSRMLHSSSVVTTETPLTDSQKHFYFHVMDGGVSIKITDLNLEDLEIFEMASDLSPAFKKKLTEELNTLFIGVPQAAEGSNSGIQIKVAKFLIEADVNANVVEPSTRGEKLIHIAARKGNKDVIEFLLNNGVGINSVSSENGWTPLHYAAWKDQLDVVKYLIGRGANLHAVDKGGDTTLHIAALGGALNVVKYLIEEKNINVNLKSLGDYGYTPLHWAAIKGKLDVIKYLIERGANLNAFDKYGYIPFYRAAQQGKVDVVEYLIEKNANVNIAGQYNRTPLHLAVMNNDLNVVEELLKVPSINLNILDVKKSYSSCGPGYKDSCGYSPLHYAARDNKLDIVKRLIESGADVNIVDSDNRTPLHFAALYNHLGIVEELLKASNIKLNILDVKKSYPSCGPGYKDSCGYSPLHYAARDNRLDIVKKLIESGADVNIANSDKITPLQLAAQYGRLDIVKKLIESDADVNTKDKEGKTPLDIAKDKGHNNIVEYLEKKLREERGERKRRHHHGDHARHHVHLSRKPLAVDSSNQPEITTSRAIKPSSWINDLFNWVKGSVGGLLNPKPTLSKETSNTSSPISQVDAKMDVNGTIMLLDVLVRKVTGQKYISTVDQSISPLEAQEYTLNITKGFEKVVEQAALKSGISMHRLDIDYMGMQKEITKKVMSGKFNEISGILKSYIKKACTGGEVGKLSPKKFDKFMVEFNSGLLNQSIEQILHNRDGRLEVDDTKQMSLEPQSYLSNSSVQGHSKVSTCLSEIGVTKLVNNLSR